MAELLLLHGQRLRDIALALDRGDDVAGREGHDTIERWHGLLGLVMASCPLVTDTWFVREGDTWAIGASPRLRLRHSRGLAHLAVLIGRPGHEVHALDLASGPVGRGVPSTDAGAVIDDSARREYAERIEELDERIAAAHRHDDLGTIDVLTAEREWIAAQLAGAFGLGGRSRRAASEAERARQSVTKAVRAAIDRIGAESPELGRHLDRSIRTGHFCVYDPELGSAPTWILDGDRRM